MGYVLFIYIGFILCYFILYIIYSIESIGIIFDIVVYIRGSRCRVVEVIVELEVGEWVWWGVRGDEGVLYKVVGG